MIQMPRRQTGQTIAMIKYILFFLLFAYPASSTEALKLKIISQDDDFTHRGYSTAKLAVFVENSGRPLADVPVILSVVSASNHSAAMAEGWQDKITGLSWDKPISGQTSAPEHITNVTDLTGTAFRMLVDIVGERTVRVRAFIPGTDLYDEIDIVFGKGPLSVFSAPFPTKMNWLEAYARCNGTEYNGRPENWEIGMGHLGGRGMPVMAQLQAVSMPGGENPVTYAMGAALAAGWREGWYWNGRAVMKDRASHVNLSTGTNHGSGGRDVRQVEYTVCTK